MTRPPTGRRAERTRANRRRMREAALGLFRERGYAATSMQAVADAAGMAVQTLHYTFGTKRALLSEILDVAVAGDDEPVGTLDRPRVQELVDEPDAERQLRMHAELAREIWGRLGPVLEVLSGAATSDPDIAALWEKNITERAEVLERLCGVLAGKAALRHDLATTVDIALGLQGPELYQLFTGRRGWTPAAYERWLAEALVGQLLAQGEAP